MILRFGVVFSSHTWKSFDDGAATNVLKALHLHLLHQIQPEPLVYETLKTRASGPKCAVTGKRIHVIPHLRPTEYKRSRLFRNSRIVNLPYGRVLPSVVRERIIRAFLLEEQKIVKKVLKLQKVKEKLASKS